jgi:hypothetical protein
MRPYYVPLLLILMLLSFTGTAQVQPFGWKDNSFPYQVNIGKGALSPTSPSAHIEIGPLIGNKGIVMPRTSDTASVAGAKLEGLVVYQLSDKAFYYFDGAWWKPFSLLYTDEKAQDAVWEAVKNSHPVHFTYDDDLNRINATVDTGYARSLFSAGAGLSYDPATGQFSAQPHQTYLTAGTGIGVSGTGAQATPYVVRNNGVLSINGMTGNVNLTFPGTYTDEQAQDATAALIKQGRGIRWEYNDENNQLIPTVTLADFSTSDLPEGSQLYHTRQRVREALGVQTPLSYDTLTGIFSITKAGALSAGYLSSEDWTRFNSKVPPTRKINTLHSLVGGGTLEQDLHLALVNDIAAPGANFYYGTDSLGRKGWHLVSFTAGEGPGGSYTGENGIDITGSIVRIKHMVVTEDSNFLIGTDVNSGHKMSIFGAIRYDQGDDAIGDIWYRDRAGSMRRLGIGINGQALLSNGREPYWGNVALSGDTTSGGGGAGQVQADWTLTTVTDPAYIKNKPHRYEERFQGLALAQFTVQRRPLEIEVFVNGVYIPGTCWSLSINSILINTSCLGYTLDSEDDITILYQSTQQP